MPENENDTPELKRLLQTGENTFYVDTGKLKSSENYTYGESENEGVIDPEVAKANLAALTGKNRNKVILKKSSANSGGGKEYYTKYEERDPKLNELEQSLINFLSQKKDIDTIVNGGMRRIRSLKLNIVIQDSKPFVTIQIGVCEAAFNIETGLKERGSCFGIERFVRDWFERAGVNSEIKKIADEKAQANTKKNSQN